VREPMAQRISPTDYYDPFLNSCSSLDKEKLEKAYQTAFETRKFEISNYWTRTNYLWLLQAAVFTGYFAVQNNDFQGDTNLAFCIICIGFITAIAWVLINKASKEWMENWENHISKLEDYVTGPLYKVISHPKTFSISKINTLMSSFFVIVWVILGLWYCKNNLTVFDNREIAWVEILSALAVLIITILMFTWGITHYKVTNIKFYKRECNILEKGGKKHG